MPVRPVPEIDLRLVPDMTAKGTLELLKKHLAKKGFGDILLYDDMTLDNGPTRLVPGSHLRAPINIPYVNIGDFEPRALTADEAAAVPADFSKPCPGEIYLTAPAGSVASTRPARGAPAPRPARRPPRSRC